MPSSIEKLDAKNVFWILGSITLIIVFAALATEAYFLLALPLLIAGAWILLADYKKLFYLLFISLAISIDIDLPGGIALNFFTEPLQLLLTGVALLLALHKGKSINSEYITHPISISLLMHIAWIAIAVYFSGDILLSVKYLLSKIWYVIPAFYLTIKLVKDVRDVQTIIWCTLIPLLFTITVIMIRHAAVGFSFEGINYVLGPFYSNHVLYASMIAVCFPFVWFMRKWYPTFSIKWWFLAASFLIMTVAIYLSYTRATMGSVFIVFGMYYVVRWRLTKPAFLIAVTTLFSLFFWLGNDNKFMNYTPNFERTITHQRFDNLLEATLKGQDISIAERYYRWIAGIYMVGEKPVFGYGPASFYNQYRPYTLSSWKTYVSDNKGKSGIHNYFLMILVEQGIPGLFFFLLFSFILFAKGEQIYHRQHDEQSKHIVMSAILSLAIIYSLLVINDMVESDKIGVIFFFCAGLLVKYDFKAGEEEKAGIKVPITSPLTSKVM